MSDFKTALEQKKYRKDNSNVTTFNTDLDDSTIGEGTAGLVKRKEMLNTIADMQEKGTLRYTDNGYYIKGDANNVSRSDLFKNTLSTVVNYNATIAEQKREKKREEEKDNREAQAQVIVDPNNTGTALVPKKTAYPGDPFAQLMDYYDTSDTNTKMHLLATGIDAATIPLGMVPGLTIASAIAGAGATTLHGIADWNSGDKWGAVKGMAMGYSLDALSVFGGKGLKAMNSIGKIGGWIKGAVPILKAGLVGGGMYAGLDAASKVKYEDILNRDISSWDTTDYANIVSLVQFISSGAKGASRGIVNTVSKGNKGFTKILGGGLEVDRNIIGKGKAKGAQMAEKLTGKFANTEEAYFDKFDHVMSRVTGRASNLDIKKGRKMSIDADEAYNKAKLNRKNAFNNLSKAQELNRKNSKGSSNWEGPFSEVRNARKVDNSSFDTGGNGQPRLAPRLLPVKYTGIAPRLLPVKYTGIAPVKQSGIASQLPVKYTGPKMGQGEFTKKFKNTDKFKREELNKGGEDIKKVQNEIDKYDKELNEAEIQRDKANKNKNDLDSNEEHFEAEKYGTVEKLESEINITKRNYENELNILDTKKKRLARRIRKDPSSVKGKKKVKEVQDEIKKLKKEMDKDISGKQGKIDTEKKSKKRFYRKPRNIIKKIHHAAIDKTNDLLGKLSMGDSDYRFLKEWMRKDPELFNKAAEGDKEATKEILSAAQRHLKIQREKLEASKAKIKREKKSGSRRLGGKLVPKYNRGGRFIRKFQNSGVVENSVDDLLNQLGVKKDENGEFITKKGEKLSAKDAREFNKSINILISGEKKEKKEEKKIKREDDWALDEDSTKDLYKKLYHAVEGAGTNEHLLNKVLDNIDKMVPKEREAFNEYYKANSGGLMTAEEAILDDVSPGIFSNDMPYSSLISPLFGSLSIDEEDEAIKGRVSKMFKKKKNKIDLSPEALKKAKLEFFEQGYQTRQDNTRVETFIPLAEVPEEKEEVKEEVVDNGKGRKGKVKKDECVEKKCTHPSKWDPKTCKCTVPIAETLEEEETKTCDDGFEIPVSEECPKKADPYKAKDLEGEMKYKKSSTFMDKVGNTLSRLNAGDIYNLVDSMRKPEEFTAAFNPMKATTLAKRKVQNMAGYDEMKSQLSTPAYNVKSSDLMAKSQLQRRNQNITNQKMMGLYGNNAQHIENTKAGNHAIGNQNITSATDTRNINNQEINRRDLMDKQSKAANATALAKRKAQLWGSIGNRVQSGLEESLVDRSYDKLAKKKYQFDKYSNMKKKRMGEIQTERDNEVKTLSDRYKNLSDENRKSTSLTNYLEANKDKSQYFNKNDVDISTDFNNEFKTKYKVDPSTDEFSSEYTNLETKYKKKLNKYQEDPKNS